MEKYRTTLPAGYREVDVIDIKNDKRVRVRGGKDEFRHYQRVGLYGGL